MNKTKAILSSKIEPNSAQKEKLETFLKKKHGQDYQIEWLKDDSIEYGFTLQISEGQYDWTIEGQLEQLENQLNSLDFKHDDYVSMLKNTFTDFIACSKFMIDKGYTSSAHLYAEGGSAGGMLMGVIANEAPELYRGILAQVPFVDVVTTMLDESIPLTTGEYDEWGNPNEREFYEYMLSYSPYDNVKKQAYPNLYVTTGFHDSQVQYWEPAKWIAKLRDFKTNDSLLLLETNMETGHGGASGRFEALKEVAKEYAFLLDLEGIQM